MYFINLLQFKWRKRFLPKTALKTWARQLKIPAHFYLKTDTVQCQISLEGKDAMMTEAKLYVSQKYQGIEENLRRREDYQWHGHKRVFLWCLWLEEDLKISMRSTNSPKIRLVSEGELNGGIFTCVLLPLQTFKKIFMPGYELMDYHYMDFYYLITTFLFYCQHAWSTVCYLGRNLQYMHVSSEHILTQSLIKPALSLKSSSLSVSDCDILVWSIINEDEKTVPQVTGEHFLLLKHLLHQHTKV